MSLINVGKENSGTIDLYYKWPFLLRRQADQHNVRVLLDAIKKNLLSIAGYIEAANHKSTFHFCEPAQIVG